MSRQRDLDRIHQALRAAEEALRPFTSGSVDHEEKSARGDPVTEADHAVDRVLRELLPEPGEGWLSEETVDDRSRLEAERVWVVDPLDGTREFVDGIPEWCISVGLVQEGRAVAGGILNPATGEEIVGALETGIRYNGEKVRTTDLDGLVGARVLASRSEVGRGKWERFGNAPFTVRPCGSVAYKLALVAAGRADATWTLVPKNEWDVAAGMALVTAGGGRSVLPDGLARRLNQEDPLLPGLIAGGPGVVRAVLEYLEEEG